MNHLQNTKIKSKRYYAIFENLHGKWPTISPLLTINSLSRQVCHRWMAPKYPCKHGNHEQLKEIVKTSISVCFANGRSDNTCHQFSLFSSNAWLLSQAMQPNSRTNLLTNFQTWIALTGKILGKSSLGKTFLCSKML